MEKEGAILEDRYKIVNRLESGGFANIYLGYDLKLYNRPVAIKMLRSEMAEDKSLAAMFFDEIVLTTRLQHENIVQVYDVIRSGDNLYLILELVNGPDLRKVLWTCREKGEVLPFELTAYILSKVCRALDYAHNRKDTSSGEPLAIVHRDISPSNILVSIDGNVKLSDFGIAKPRYHHREKTSTGILKGKISYMSPEQVRAEELDRRSDIYSLGIVMYEMFTQTKLFDAESDFELIQIVGKGKVRIKPINDAKVPGALKAILRKALQKKASKRYATAYDMYSDLNDYLSGFKPASLPSKLHDTLAGLGLTEESPLQRLHEAEPVKGMADLTRELVEAAAEEDEEERTIYDLIRLSSTKRTKTISLVSSSLIAVFIAFIGLSTVLQWNPMGRWIYNKIYRPAIVIESSPPGARVTLGGDLLGKTPLARSRIEAGTYELALALDGYGELRRSLAVLEKKRGEGPDTVRYNFEIPLSIESKPAGAAIYIDERRCPGVTPATIPCEVKDDPVEIQLEKAGFEPVKKTVSLRADPRGLSDRFWEISRRKNPDGIFRYENLVRFYAKVTIESDPAEARLIVDEVDTLVLDKPKTLRLSMGKHHLKMEKGGFTWEKDIEIEDGEAQSITAELSKAIEFVAYDEKTGKKLSCRVSIKTSKGESVVSLKSTPAHVNLKSRESMKATFSKKGYEPRAVRFDPSKAKKVEARLKMKRKVTCTMKLSVTDQATGRAIPKAWVYLTRKKGQQPRDYQGETSRNGTFVKTLSPGYYRIMVTHKEYRPSQEEGAIEPGHEVRIPIRLERASK